MKLIDVDALTKNFLEHCRTEYEIKNHVMCDENVLALIQNAPTVEERPQCEWINQDFDDLKISDYRCNQCGHYQDDITNFCPNCGADMRGGAE